MDRLVITDQRLRDLYLVVVKLADLAARAGFVLAATYGLHIAEAGQFGLITTLVTLFAFAFNFERHIDIQRRTVGEPGEVLDRYVTSALGFFAFNWALMIPLFVGSVLLLAHVSLELTLLAVIVVVGEHLSNQTYLYAMVAPRYYPLLVVVAAKNLGLAAVVLWQIFLSNGGLDLERVMLIWAIGAVLCTAVLAVMWLSFRRAAPRETAFHFAVDILGQHKASAVHFTLGLVAILILQYDRLAVGALMSLDQVGIYFRHTLLVSLAYQMFNVASYNRITPAVFAAAKEGGVAQVHGMVLREYRKALVGAGLLLAAALAAYFAPGNIYERFHLSFPLIFIMVFGFTLRAAADFHALVLNAVHREAEVLRRQAIAFAVGAVLLIPLTWWQGIYGAAVALVLTSTLYLALIFRSVVVLRHSTRAPA